MPEPPPRPLRVCLSPALMGQHPELPHTTVVVIDVLRASTTICTALAHGIRRIRPCATVAEAADFQAKGYLAAAERDGQTVPGFERGNSPLAYMTDANAGRDLALTTTNGTRALDAARHAQRVLIGGFVNLSCLAADLAQGAGPLLLLCAGWKGAVNVEDTAFAGALARRLGTRVQPADDASNLAIALARQVQQQPLPFLRRSIHGDRLRRLGLLADVKYCLRADTQAVIPVLQEDHLCLMA